MTISPLGGELWAAGGAIPAVGGDCATAVLHRRRKYLMLGYTQGVIGILQRVQPDGSAGLAMPVVVMSLGAAKPHILMFLVFDFRVARPLPITTAKSSYTESGHIN